MKEKTMGTESSIQHDLRREFHNMLGILKIIKQDGGIQDEELNSMLDLCLQRELAVTQWLDELTTILESNRD